VEKVIRIVTSGCCAVVVFFLLQSGAFAHVVVKPAQSPTGSVETYTIQIPTEKKVPTKKVALRIPKNAEFLGYRPVAGWSVTTTKDADGKVKTVTWSAKGKGIAPGEFQQFQFTALNPKTKTKLAWNAYQYYQDSSIVEWTGRQSSETPHSITKIIDSQSATVQTQQWTAGRGTFILSLIAAVLAALSLVLSVVSFYRTKAAHHAR
jgi:uncharacterized protein YcnI